MFKRFSGAIAALILCTASAQAADFRLDFTATNFGVPLFGSGPAPFNLATGHIVFSADTLSSDWTEVIDFDLTVGSAHYKLSDVGVELFADGAYIGGLLSAANGVQLGTDDFLASFHTTQSSQNFWFGYSSKEEKGFWSAQDIKQTVTAIPEPETYAMMLGGLALLGAVARRKAKK